MPAEKLLLDPKSRVKAMTVNSSGYMSNNPSSQALMSKMDPFAEAGFTNHHHLKNNSSEESIDVQRATGSSPSHINRSQWVTLIILTFVNLINYMDRYTIAGILTEVQKNFDITNAQAGLLQTAFVFAFMIFAPLFGFLGDRYNRKWVMVVGITIWAGATFIGSFMTDFYSFMAMRAVVGIGEASYTTIAPTILSDLFVKDMRSKALAVFYFAIPVGSGLGYVVGKALAAAFNEWQWALRGTPVLGVVAVLLIAFFLVDPPRGESEGHEQLKPTSYMEDLRSLATNKSFLFSTLGFTCVTFCTGALSWWGPKFLEDAIRSANVAKEDLPIDPTSIAFVFGIVTMMSGIIGVPMGSLMSTKWRPKNQRIDPLICSLGLALSSVFLCCSLFLVNGYFFLAFTLIFLGEISLNLNWSIVADILLYVVVPTRRGTAEAIQILFSHLFGDAGSPYLIGTVSDAMKINTVTEEAYCLNSGLPILAENATLLCDHTRDFYSMQYSLVVNIGIVFLGALCFLFTAIYIIKDKERVERFVADACKLKKPLSMTIGDDADDESEEEMVNNAQVGEIRSLVRRKSRIQEI